MSALLRPITGDDYAAVLAWNEAHVELLSPLTEDRLSTLLAVGDQGSVIVHEDRDVGFVLTFAAGSAYDSANYRWFSERHPRFLYLDRVVIDASVRRAGVASRVYDELEARAAGLGPVMCLEVNLVPPNEPSLAFHHRRGYVEVGQEQANGHVVTRLEKALTATG
jgi:predicted GNAT superfamily acetyltransferase